MTHKEEGDFGLGSMLCFKESLKKKVYNFNLQLIGFQSFANF
jgi:hypothetical protein